MPLDAYTLCPGGTGKKIKFCCSDLLGDLKELIRMIEGEQHAAALRHIESLESKAGSPRACLFALKIQLLQTMDRDDDARAAARQFLEHFPDNPIALAESAIDRATTEQNGPAAMEQLQKALAAGTQQIYSQVYDAISAVAQQMIASAFVGSARALWRLQMMMHKDDPEPREMMANVSRSSAVALLLKDEPPLDATPKNASLRKPFAEAMQPLTRANWVEAARRFESLAQQAPAESAVWRNLAVLRDWLADHKGAVAALRKYAALDVPLEDAVEATATAMLLSDDPLGDLVDELRLTFPVGDADELAGLLSTWKQAEVLPVDPRYHAEEEVPPKMLFWLLNRPRLDSADGLSLDNVPTLLGQGLLYGRQTDREARLVMLGVTTIDEQTAIDALHGMAGGRITGPPARETINRLPASRFLLRRPWRLPPGTPSETVSAMVEQLLQRAVFEEWPRVKLGVLGDRSAEEAAAMPDQKIPLLAAIMVLESWVQQMGQQVDFNRLRAKLGLPALAPLGPLQATVEDVPLARLHRLTVETLPDDKLMAGFHRAVAFGAREAVLVFGREAVGRSTIDGKQKRFAYVAMSQAERNPQHVLECIERGRASAEADGESSASWDLAELEFRMRRQEANEVRRLLQHLAGQHIREPGVAEALQDLLYEAGVIDAEGRPRQHELPPDEMPAATEDEPAGQLWTPDSEKPAGAKSKLWTPDME